MTLIVLCCVLFRLPPAQDWSKPHTTCGRTSYWVGCSAAAVTKVGSHTARGQSSPPSPCICSWGQLQQQGQQQGAPLPPIVLLASRTTPPRRRCTSYYWVACQWRRTAGHASQTRPHPLSITATSCKTVRKVACMKSSPTRLSTMKSRRHIRRSSQSYGHGWRRQRLWRGYQSEERQ